MGISAPASASSLNPAKFQHFQTRIQDRMQHRPRYRLLQGHPMPKLMLHAEDSEREMLLDFLPIQDRKLIIGVIPHTFCNPQVKDCGWCTFPHESYSAEKAHIVSSRVVEEIETRSRRLGLGRKEVDSIYFGGGTANLTSPDDFLALAIALDESLKINSAEVTIEGTPQNFIDHIITRDAAILDVLETLPAASKRISIGVQTLKPESIEEMGRKRFGNLETIDKLIGKAHKRDISVNGDFLINMPNQPVAAMLSDIETAIRIGFDQICLYSLVLFEGLGSTWSRMPEKLAGMPQVETAYANWLRVRQMLLEAGFVQTTQTNFERQEVNQGPNKFRYELSSFDPSGVDGIGFGPAGITMITDPKSQRGIKILNTHKSMRYAEQIEKSDTAFGFWHYYANLDDLLMGLWARNFSRGFVRRIEGYDPVERHPELIEALVEAGLLTISPKRVEVTTRGSFFTDTIIGLLTEERAQQIREGNQENQRIIARNHLNDYTDFYGDSDDWGGGGM